MQVLFIVFATFFHLFTNFFPATKKGFICLSYLCTRKLMEVLAGRLKIAIKREQCQVCLNNVEREQFIQSGTLLTC